MKFLLQRSIPVLIVFLSTVVSFGQQSVNFMSFNVRDETLDPDPPFSWDARKADCYKVINDSQADIIGFQECTWTQMQDIFANCPTYEQAGNGTHAIIMYDKSKWENIETGAFWLSPTPDVPHSVATEWGAIYERVAVYALLKNVSTGFTIYAYNTHYSHVSDQAKAESTYLIAQRIADREIPQFPFVFMGDLNAGADNEAVKYLIDENTGSPIRMSQTWNAYSNTWDEGSTFNGQDGWTSGYGIDHILVEEGVGTTTYAEIDRVKYNDSAWPSDHYPLAATVEFPNQTQPILRADQSSLQFLMSIGDLSSTDSQFVQLDNIGAGDAGEITVVSNQLWVSAITGSDGEYEVSLTAAAEGLAEGEHVAIVSFSSAGAANTVEVPINLTVFSGCLFMEGYDQDIDQDHYTMYNGITQTVEEKFTFAAQDGVFKLSSAGHDEWDFTTVDFHQEGQPAVFDFSDPDNVPVLTIRVKADGNCLLRASLKDATNLEADNGNLDYWMELTDEYQTFQIDFTNNLFNQHQGGMDPSTINGLVFRINSGFASQWAYVGEITTYDFSFVGNIEIDYIKLSACPEGVSTGVEPVLAAPIDTFYPNPFATTLIVKPGFDGAHFRLMDLTGQEVYHAVVNGRSIALPTGLSAGIYWADLDDRNGKNLVQKLVKQ